MLIGILVVGLVAFYAFGGLTFLIGPFGCTATGGIGERGTCGSPVMNVPIPNDGSLAIEWTCYTIDCGSCFQSTVKIYNYRTASYDLLVDYRPAMCPHESQITRVNSPDYQDANGRVQVNFGTYQTCRDTSGIGRMACTLIDITTNPPSDCRSSGCPSGQTCTLSGSSYSCVTSTIPEPPAPSFNWLQIIIDFIRYLLSGNWLPFSIYGVANEVSLYEPITATITLESPVAPDADYSDGTATSLFGTTYVADSQGNVLQTGTPIELTGTSFVGTNTYTPTVTGRYIVGGIVARTDNTYSFQAAQWSGWSEPAVVIEERQVFDVVGAPAPPAASIDFGQVIADFFAGIRTWFCQNVGVFC